ncbi:hypothetical protein OAL69_01635 [Pelagibacteraceae bacterium]|nr:hypothetical protein [Pelagibacteraceae bacterium]
MFQIEIETLNKTETKSIAEDQAQKLFSKTLILLLKQENIRSIIKFQNSGTSYKLTTHK